MGWSSDIYYEGTCEGEKYLWYTYSFSKNTVDAINNNKKILLLFIDLANAFDSINTDIVGAGNKTRSSA
jgi:hypothetical protein